MPTDKQLAANRQNARSSTGPNTPEGKSRSSRNALKHGLRGADYVLPHEDADAFDARLAHWHAAYNTDDPAQLALLEVAAHASWKLKRSARAETARLAKAARDAESPDPFLAEARAAALGRRLLGQHNDPKATADDLSGPRLAQHRRDDPAALRLKLKATPAGVDWLLSAWTQVTTSLEADNFLLYNDVNAALRLLGHRPTDIFHAPQARTFFLACFGLHPEDRRDLNHAVRQSCQAMYAHPTELDYLAGHHLADRVPPDEETASNTVHEIIADEIDHLAALRDLYEAEAAADDADAADRASFDDAASPLIRRYESSLEHTLRRTIADLTRLRDLSPKPTPDPDSETPEPEPDEAPTPTPEPEPSTPDLETPSDRPSRSRPRRRRRPKAAHRSLPNEPNSAPTSDPRRPLANPHTTPEVARTPHPGR